jgi:hypothetical protein
VEYIKVAGSCSEDHVGEKAAYEGSIVHWLNVQKKTDVRYGWVTHWSDVGERVKNPHKYSPPFSVEFRDLGESDVAGDQLILRGVSERTEGGPRYESTCSLHVTERLDHIPGKPSKDLGRK